MLDISDGKISVIIDVLRFVYFIGLFLTSAYYLFKASVIKSIIANEIEKKGVDKHSSVYASYFKSEVVRILGDKKEVIDFYDVSYVYFRKGFVLLLIFGASVGLL